MAIAETARDRRLQGAWRIADREDHDTQKLARRANGHGKPSKRPVGKDRQQNAR